MRYDGSAGVPAAVRRASPLAAPRARRPRDSRQDAGATVQPACEVFAADGKKLKLAW
jgi:hypothetical protein